MFKKEPRMRAEQAAGHLLELLSSGDSKPTGKGRASSLAAWRAQRSHLLELLSSWDSKPTWKAEQAAWQLDGLSDPTFSSYCRAGKVPSLEASFGLCNPTLPEHRYYIIFSTTTTNNSQKKKNLPYPVFCGFCEDIVWLRAYSIFDIV